MKTTIEQLEGCTLVTLDGELNTAASAEVKKAKEPTQKDPPGSRPGDLSVCWGVKNENLDAKSAPV